MNKRYIKNVTFRIILPGFIAGLVALGFVELFQFTLDIYSESFIIWAGGFLAFLTGTLIMSIFKWEEEPNKPVTSKEQKK